jgi:hypothetical protein
MKLSERKTPLTAEEKRQAALEDLLEPDEDEEQDDSSDDGEVIDRSEFLVLGF